MVDDENDIEKMEQQIEVVITKIDRHRGLKRKNSLTVLAGLFNRYEQRCLNLITKRKVPTCNQ